MVLVIGAVAYFMGFNPLALLEGGGTGGQRAALDSPQEKEKVAFVSAVLVQTEDVWSNVFKAGGSAASARKAPIRTFASLARTIRSSSQTPATFTTALRSAWIGLC